MLNILGSKAGKNGGGVVVDNGGIRKGAIIKKNIYEYNPFNPSFPILRSGGRGNTLGCNPLEGTRFPFLKAVASMVNLNFFELILNVLCRSPIDNWFHRFVSQVYL